VTVTAQSVELRSIAQGIADALPATVEEVVLTGSVSRGVADDVSDIEMLIVTQGELDLGDCFLLAAACGVTDLGTWGRQDVPTKRVSGYRDGVPVELIWWSRDYAETAIDAIFAGDLSATADAIASGLALRTSGLLPQWQDALKPGLAADAQAVRGSGRRAATQARTSGGADRGGADRARSSSCAAGHDRASGRDARTRAGRAERQQGAEVAQRRP
jgi:hypothetical protein